MGMVLKFWLVGIAVDGEYQVSQFREGERIESLIFPELDLTADQIFQAGE
jgi:Uma2 family endonuclease